MRALGMVHDALGNFFCLLRAKLIPSTILSTPVGD